ncbi:MAG: hypothetical protein ACJASV_000746 [Pseudorhodobacter sp.]
MAYITHRHHCPTAHILHKLGGFLRRLFVTGPIYNNVAAQRGQVDRNRTSNILPRARDEGRFSGE